MYLWKLEQHRDLIFPRNIGPLVACTTHSINLLLIFLGLSTPTQRSLIPSPRPRIVTWPALSLEDVKHSREKHDAASLMRTSGERYRHEVKERGDAERRLHVHHRERGVRSVQRRREIDQQRKHAVWWSNCTITDSRRNCVACCRRRWRRRVRPWAARCAHLSGGTHCRRGPRRAQRRTHLCQTVF
jgi:hypothetical protein